MAETQIKSIKGQDTEKAQEKKRRLEPAPVPMKALADESIPFPRYENNFIQTMNIYYIHDFLSKTYNSIFIL